jgi:hypothetical protein
VQGFFEFLHFSILQIFLTIGDKICKSKSWENAEGAALAMSWLVGKNGR